MPPKTSSPAATHAARSASLRQLGDGASATQHQTPGGAERRYSPCGVHSFNKRIDACHLCARSQEYIANMDVGRQLTPVEREQRSESGRAARNSGSLFGKTYMAPAAHAAEKEQRTCVASKRTKSR